jgi:hypothetical protein
MFTDPVPYYAAQGFLLILTERSFIIKILVQTLRLRSHEDFF